MRYMATACLISLVVIVIVSISVGLLISKRKPSAVEYQDVLNEFPVNSVSYSEPVLNNLEVKYFGIRKDAESQTIIVSDTENCTHSIEEGHKTDNPASNILNLDIESRAGYQDTEYHIIDESVLDNLHPTPSVKDIHLLFDDDGKVSLEHDYPITINTELSYSLPFDRIVKLFG